MAASRRPRSRGRNHRSMIPPTRRMSSISRPPPDMGLDDAEFGGGTRATKVGVGGMRGNRQLRPLI